jgi:hypothetical protein
VTDIYKFFLQNAVEKGCNTACCGIDAFYNSALVEKAFSALIARPDELITWLPSLPQDSAADIVGTIEVLSDIAFLAEQSENLAPEIQERLVAATDELARGLERKLAKIRRGNR